MAVFKSLVMVVDEGFELRVATASDNVLQQRFLMLLLLYTQWSHSTQGSSPASFARQTAIDSSGIKPYR